MRGKLVAVGALVASITLGTMGSALGGNGPLPPITVNPESGTPGTTFTVSGEDCIFDPDTTAASDVEAAGPPPADLPTVVVTVNFPTPLVAETIAAQDGTWSVELTVPAGTPPGSYGITADCQSDPPPRATDVGAAELYPPGATFTVLQGEVPVTPLVPEAGAATPAPAVAGAPRFTG